MNEQELNQKFAGYEAQIRQLQEQLNAVEKTILDLSSIFSGLDELKGEEDKEFLAPIGRGIFARAKLISEKLTVEIGDGMFTEKTIDDTKKLITEQQKKLKDMQTNIENDLEKVNKEITATMKEFQAQQNK